MLSGFLKGVRIIISHLPYKFVVRLGRNCGKLYWYIAKKQRIRAEETIQERMGVSPRQAREIIHRLFLNLGMTAMEMFYMPALNKDNIRFVVPHQANIRIIEAVAKRLDLPMDQVMVNIEHFGNTSAATIPLALWEYENKLKKGDNLIFTAFGAGFVHGASYFKWGYDGDKFSEAK